MNAGAAESESESPDAGITVDSVDRMNVLEFHILKPEEVEHFERTPHNAPLYSDSFTEEDFSKEWWAAREALKERLELFGEEWQLRTYRGDFMLSPARGNSRWIYVTFVTTRLWRPEFVATIANLLRSLPQDYRIGFLTELEDDDLLDSPMVYLVVSKTSVYGRAQQGQFEENGSIVWTECPEELRRFGFPA